MLELRERGRKKHIVSDDKAKAFAWAGYYANHSYILINGKEYWVVYEYEVYIEFSDGTYLPCGNYVIFKSADETIICNNDKLEDIRNENPLEHHYICFNDETFLEVA